MRRFFFLSLEEDGSLYLNSERLTEAGLKERVRAELQRNPLTQVFLKADRALDFGRILRVMNACRGAGVSGVSWVTADPPRRRIIS
jgi:biopolymer transport protein TolR